jgi:hypothetical protein
MREDPEDSGRRMPAVLAFLAKFVFPLWAAGFLVGALMPVLDLLFGWRPIRSPYWIAGREASAAEFALFGSPAFLLASILCAAASYGTRRRRSWARIVIVGVFVYPVLLNVPYVGNAWGEFLRLTAMHTVVILLPVAMYLYLRSPVRRYFAFCPKDTAA